MIELLSIGLVLLALMFFANNPVLFILIIIGILVFTFYFFSKERKNVEERKESTMKDIINDTKNKIQEYNYFGDTEDSIDIKTLEILKEYENCDKEYWIESYKQDKEAIGKENYYHQYTWNMRYCSNHMKTIETILKKYQYVMEFRKIHCNSKEEFIWWNNHYYINIDKIKTLLECDFNSRYQNSIDVFLYHTIVNNCYYPIFIDKFELLDISNLSELVRIILYVIFIGKMGLKCTVISNNNFDNETGFGNKRLVKNSYTHNNLKIIPYENDTGLNDYLQYEKYITVKTPKEISYCNKILSFLQFYYKSTEYEKYSYNNTNVPFYLPIKNNKLKFETRTELLKYLEEQLTQCEIVDYSKYKENPRKIFKNNIKCYLPELVNELFFGEYKTYDSKAGIFIMRKGVYR